MYANATLCRKTRSHLHTAFRRNPAPSNVGVNDFWLNQRDNFREFSLPLSVSISVSPTGKSYHRAYRVEFTRAAVTAIKKRLETFQSGGVAFLASSLLSLPLAPSPSLPAVRTSTARDAHDKSNLQRDTAAPFSPSGSCLSPSPSLFLSRALICSYFRAL